MIGALRRKFILVAMCSTLAVLSVIFWAVQIYNYKSIMVRADQLLEMLGENRGEFPQNSENQEKKDRENEFYEKKEPGDGPGFNTRMSPDTPFETRFFYVVLDENGKVTETEVKNIASIDQVDARQYGQVVWKSGKTSGMYKKCRYKVVKEEGQTRIIFVNCTRDLETFHNFLIISMFVSCLGLVLVFILVLIFSRMVFRPVAESYEKQKQFITDASHELKTPLTIIDANTEVLEMMEGENEWTGSTRKQVRRLAHLTNQMVELSRMDEAGTLKNKVEFPLSEAVEEETEPFELLAKSKGKELIWEIEPGIRIKGDEAMIRQLISLLLDNAVKYSNENGKIHLYLVRKGKKVRIQISNEVLSISKGNLNQLFERFYRTDHSRNSSTGGSGIGLSIAKAIVEAHKGRISAYSEDGKSLMVTVLL